MAAKVAMAVAGSKEICTKPADPDPGFLLVAVRAQPRARRAGVGGMVAGADGRDRLRVAVTEAPEDGRASKAVCAALARALDVPVSRVTLQGGAAAREKLLRVQGDRAVLSERLRVLMQPGAVVDDDGCPP